MITLVDTPATTPAQVREFAQAQVKGIAAYMEVITAIPTKGLYVQALGSFFVQHVAGRLAVGGIQNAHTYTLAQLEAMAEYGVGVPTYTNGIGERSELITMHEGVKRAADAQLKAMGLYVDIINK